MKKIPVYRLFPYRFLALVASLTTLPFMALKVYAPALQELPYMFVALILIIRFFIGQMNDTKRVENLLKAKLSSFSQVSRGQQVEIVANYKLGLDVALAMNVFMIFAFDMLWT